MNHRWILLRAGGALALGGVLLARPQAAAQGFADGLRLCGGRVLPALFPLFVVCALAAPLAPVLGRPLHPLTRLCGIHSPQAPALLLLSWCGGYAVCAQQIAALVRTRQLSRRDAALLLLLGCCSGPGFVIGCIGGQLLGSTAAGVWLYGTQLAANFAAAACLLPFLPRQSAAGDAPPADKDVTLPQAMGGAVQSSLTVCGCVLFFRTVGCALGQGLPDAVQPYLSAALEISAGCADFAAAGSIPGLALCLSALGASVFAQLAALLDGAAPLGLLAASRALHGIFMQLLVWRWMPLPEKASAVFSTLAPRVVVMQLERADTALAIFFFLCAALYRLYKTRENSYNK